MVNLPASTVDYNVIVILINVRVHRVKHADFHLRGWHRILCHQDVANRSVEGAIRYTSLIRHLVSVVWPALKKRIQASRHSCFIVALPGHRIGTGNAGIHTACVLVELLVLLVRGLIWCLGEGHHGDVGRRRLLHRLAPIPVVIRDLIMSIFAELL